MLLFHSNPLKRKEAPDDGEKNSLTPTSGISNLPPGEYETGRVICELCGSGVSFRDEETGGFTLKHWDTHRLNWWVTYHLNTTCQCLIAHI